MNDLLIRGASVYNGVYSGGFAGSAVFTFDSIDFSSPFTITVTGSLPFAFLSKADLTIGGSISYNAVTADGPEILTRV